MEMGHSRVALALSVIFIFCGFYVSLSLPFVGFLAFLFSSSFSFFQKRRHSMGSKEKISPQIEVAMGNEETQEEKREEEVVQESERRDEEQDTMLSCSAVKSDLQQVELLEFSSDSSTESISDDESLIEISLPDGDHVEDYPELVFEEEEEPEGEFIWDLMPESIFKQTGIMELLSEINEEDNMIEIDISRGSIKCPSLGIMA